jgi:uncharacterized protein (TIGR02594 family)
MRSFLAALLLCYCVTMPVLVAFPMGDSSPSVTPLVQAKATDRAPIDAVTVVERVAPVVVAELPRPDDLAPLVAAVIDQRVQMASLAPVEIVSTHNDPVSVKDAPTPRPRMPFVEQPKPKRDLLKEARKYLGTNPTGWTSVWCAKFMAMIAPDLAAKVDNPNWARDWAELPKAKPRPGVIVVLKRGNAGHIGVVSGFDKHGNPIVISGNTSGHKGHSIVAEGVFPKSRVLAYVVAGL